MDEGYIKIDRKILNWEWYTNINTFKVFMHCLLKANWTDGRFQGITVKRGSFVTSFEKIAEETGLTKNEARTAIKHLKITGELTHLRHGNFTVITVLNYSKYQDNALEINTPCTRDTHHVNIALTTIEEEKELKELKNKPPKPPYGDGGLITRESIISQYDFKPELLAKVKEWLIYKDEISDSYKPTGLKVLLNKISNKAKEYGDSVMITLIDESMANGWKGIVWDNINTASAKQQTYRKPPKENSFTGTMEEI